MPPLRRMNDASHIFVNGLTSRIVASSGIPSDRYHLGKIILQSLKDAPDFIMQIDGATGEMETNESALKRTIQCAIGLKKIGLKTKDVMVIMSPNHIDVTVPFYAALYLGITIAPVDYTMDSSDLQKTFRDIKPNILFCQNKKLTEVKNILSNSDFKCHIITFDKEVIDQDVHSFSAFMQNYGDDTCIENFRPADFDPSDTLCFLLPTSGTTGEPKAIASTHKNYAVTFPYSWSGYTKFPTPTSMLMTGSPLHWLSAAATFLFSPIVRCTRLQSSLPIIDVHAYNLINKYKPSVIMFSTTVMFCLMKSEKRKQCDFSSIETIYLGGTHVPQDFINEIKDIVKDAEVINVYGSTELGSLAFFNENSPPGSCGKQIGCLLYRLIDIDTQDDISQPFVAGELWLKGPGIFKEYYNDPFETKLVLTDDGWYKTGDMFYRDENRNFYFVDRIKLLLKYRSNKISPVEIEEVIRLHPGVLDVVVIGIPDTENGDLPAACIVPRDGYNINAHEIHTLIKKSLSDIKQLRGGIIFLKEMPMTSSTKVHRRKVREIVLQMNPIIKNNMVST